LIRLELRRDLVIVACAISAGIHGALVSAHFEESTGAGLGFAAATVVLVALVLALTLRPAGALALAVAAAVLLGLLASYLLAATTGLPVVHPQPEPVEGLALAAKAVEAGGLLAAVDLLWHARAGVASAPPQTKGLPT
jgi:hypothetical protein